MTERNTRTRSAILSALICLCSSCGPINSGDRKSIVYRDLLSDGVLVFAPDNSSIQIFDFGDKQTKCSHGELRICYTGFLPIFVPHERGQTNVTIGDEDFLVKLLPELPDNYPRSAEESAYLLVQAHEDNLTYAYYLSDLDEIEILAITEHYGEGLYSPSSIFVPSISTQKIDLNAIIK